MHLFLSFFLYGVLFGVAIYATTYFISKELEYKIRTYILFIVGALFIMISFLIGGFTGMPLIFPGLGVILFAILLLMFGKKEVYRRTIIAMVIFFVLFTFVFFKVTQAEYWIIKKNNLINDDPVSLYVEKLEEEPNIKGYKLFEQGEGYIIVLSLGIEMKNNNIEVLEISEEYGKTLLKVKSFSRNSVSENPYVIIGIDKVESNIEIVDTDGTSYEEIH